MDSTDLAGILALFSMAMLVGIGVPLGAIGIQLLTMPNFAFTINSYTAALMFITFALFAAIIVYTKVRLSVGVLKIQKREN
jgi:hypothetical protein